MSEKERHCDPKCEFFRCGQRALIYQRGGAYCRWGDDVCSAATCNYATCLRARLLANGVCGLSVKRKTAEVEEPEEPKLVVRPDKLDKKILKKVGSDILEEYG